MIENDDVFGALASVQRRQLLVRLLNHDPQSVLELSGESRELLEAHEALLHEFLSGSAEIANADKDAIRLYHVHLPTLAEYGFVRWDRAAHFVTRGPQFDDVKPLLEVLDDHREDAPAKEVLVPLRR